MVKYEIARDRTALLVIDMSNDFLQTDSPAEVAPGRRIIPQISRLTTAARQASIQIIYFTVSWSADGSDIESLTENWAKFKDAGGRPRTCVAGTSGIEICQELAPEPGDLLLEKQRFSCFAGTGLDDLLTSRDIDTVIISGVAANGCCESTARDAVNKDYRVIYVSDANATIDLPDAGWGPVTAEETMRVLLTEMAFAVGEVAGSDELCERFVASPSGDRVTVAT